MLTLEQKNQFSDILEELGKKLDISESQYDAAVKSYQAVGDWLSKDDSILAPYKPQILPQGSFMLGTMIRPINDQDDLDVDLVCQLTGKKPVWTQADLKKIVGDRLKAHEVYKYLLDEEGRRCWTLEYRKKSQNGDKYHMDILPSIINEGYSIVLEKAFSALEYPDYDKLAIRITDKKEDNYNSSTNIEQWKKSNPFGYGRWFYDRASIQIRKTIMLSESIKPLPKYQMEKLPLQRVVQILKRHRDMMFNGDDDKPISIIITTLASKAYNKEINIIEALQNIIEKMPLYVEERYSLKHGRKIKWISNPVNEEENFADKWVEEPQKERNFYKWITQVKIDVENSISKRGIQLIQESMEKPFGKDIIQKAFSSYGDNLLKQRQNGDLKMAAGTGMLGSIGSTVKGHNFHGE